jgi:translation initiation factor IF-3
LSRPFPSRPSFSQGSLVRVNGKIRAREVRVIGPDSQQMGIFPLADAINMARSRGVDLVEIAPNATPPVCRLVDFGKYRYEQAKKDKEARKHQHANKVKEIQLSPQIDPHDFGVKLHHAIDFLCEDMKVKVTLRFRGREMAHKEFGFQQVEKFTREIAPFGHPDAAAKLVGKGITVMFSPLPRNKRAKNPHADAESEAPDENNYEKDGTAEHHVPDRASGKPGAANDSDSSTPNSGFNNAFSKLNLDSPPESAAGG